MVTQTRDVSVFGEDDRDVRNFVLLGLLAEILRRFSGRTPFFVVLIILQLIQWIQKMKSQACVKHRGNHKMKEKKTSRVSGMKSVWIL